MGAECSHRERRARFILSHAVRRGVRAPSIDLERGLKSLKWFLGAECTFNNEIGVPQFIRINSHAVRPARHAHTPARRKQHPRGANPHKRRQAGLGVGQAPRHRRPGPPPPPGGITEPMAPRAEGPARRRRRHPPAATEQQRGRPPLRI